MIDESVLFISIIVPFKLLYSNSERLVSKKIILSPILNIYSAHVNSLLFLFAF